MNDKLIEQAQVLEMVHSAVMDMLKKVKFDEKKHEYTVIATGDILQGVSKVSSIVPKDWLSAWGAKEAVKFLGYSDYENDFERAKEVMAIIKKIEKPEEYISFLKEAKGASGRKSKTALIDGTAGHEWLENYVKARIRGSEIPTIPSEALKRPIEQFLKWEKENVAYWIVSEARVAFPEKGYAGTLDAMAMLKNGRLAIIDFKFASHLSEDYYLQTAGYQATFEPYNIKIDDRIIIRFPKTLEREEWDEKEHKYKMVENNLEVETVKSDYEFDRDAFFHALPLKKWINIITKK